MKISFSPVMIASLVGALLCLQPAQAQIDGSWNAHSGAWGTPGNWLGSPDPVPGGTGSTISFANTSYSVRNITLDGERLAGILHLGANGTADLQAGTGGLLVFDNGASIAQLHYSGSYSQKITAPIMLNSSLNVSSAGWISTGSASLSGDMTAGGADTVKMLAYTAASGGAGRLSLSGRISDGAGNRTISIHMNAADGYMVLNGDNSFSGGVRVSAGALGLEGSGLSANAFGTGVLTLDGGTLKLRHFTNLTPGNDTVVSADSTVQIQKSSTTAGPTYTLGALSIGGHRLHVHNDASGSATGIDTLVFGATTLTGNATFQVESESTAPTSLRLGALNGAFDLTKTGDGTLDLQSAAGTYSGTTRLKEGILAVGHNTALGSGALVVDGASAATVRIGSGVTMGNAITFSSTHASSAVERVAAAAALNTGTTGGLTSAFDNGIDTTAVVREGTASEAGTLSMRFSPTADAANDAERVADVFSLDWSAAGPLAFALELSTGVEATGNLQLGWFDDGTWKLATDEITGGDLAGEYGMSLTTFLTLHGPFNAATMLGAYGYDSGTGTAWAVVNRTGDFTLIAPIPEPSTWGLLGLGLTFLALRRRSSTTARLRFRATLKPCAGCGRRGESMS